MGKLLSWVLIGFGIYVAYKVVLALQRKSALRETARDQKGASDATAGSPDKKKAGRNPAAGGGLVQLVSCARCGLQLPRDEALGSDQLFFCGEAHARLGASSRDGL